MFVRLSYDVEPESPGWPGNPTMEHRYTTHTSWGSPDTHSLITIFSHFGSHIDAPSHHIDGGAGICDLALDFYIYDEPLLVDVPKGEVEMVEAADLAPFASAMRTCDGLFIRTGWSSKRSQEPILYAERGPAISSGAADYIMNGCPNLRGVGMDSISIGSPLGLDDAIAAHEIFAGMRGHGRGVILIEDIHLNVEADRLVRVLALPLFMKGLEGSPCTVVAQLGSKEQ
jgi:arylformamidase